MQGVAPTIPRTPALFPSSSRADTPMSPSASGNQGATQAEPPAFTNQHPVDVLTGEVKLFQQDITLPGIGFGFDLERTYSSTVDEVGPFGLGWQYNWGSLLRMYAEFTMGEFRHDGSTKNYSFVKEDPDAYITIYDEDEMVNYELHKGYYEPSSHGEMLERISQHEYVMTKPDGGSITYNGYFAPWRSEQDPTAGKMIEQKDRYGNTITFAYDTEGNISKVTDTAGRVIRLVWSEGLITEVIDPLGQF